MSVESRHLKCLLGELSLLMIFQFSCRCSYFQRNLPISDINKLVIWGIYVVLE